MPEYLLQLISSLPIPSVDITSLDPSTLKILIVAIVLFLFAILFAFTRRHIIHTSLNGLWAGLFIGMIIILGIEAGIFMFYKNYVFGTKADLVPQNFKVVINESQENINRVLGLSTIRVVPTAQSITTDYKLLPEIDQELVTGAICK